MASMKIKYNLIGAAVTGVQKHPQEDVAEMGMIVLHFDGHPVMDCALMEVENLPEDLPNYIEVFEGKKFVNQ